MFSASLLISSLFVGQYAQVPVQYVLIPAGYGQVQQQPSYAGYQAPVQQALAYAPAYAPQFQQAVQQIPSYGAPQYAPAGYSQVSAVPSFAPSSGGGRSGTNINIRIIVGGYPGASTTFSTDDMDGGGGGSGGKLTWPVIPIPSSSPRASQTDLFRSDLVRYAGSRGW